MSQTGKVALVTGGAQGIGRSFSESLLEEGASVAVVEGTKLGLKHMSKQNGGRGGLIVNVASVAALEPFPSIPVYSATKAAVNQLSRSYGHDVYYFKTGVKVISISPGLTKTPMTEIVGKNALPDDQELIDNYIKHFSTLNFQEVSNMGKGLKEVLVKAPNGSIWTIEDDAPPKLTILK